MNASSLLTCPLTNRAGLPVLSPEFKHPADGWYHIEAKGEHPNAAAGVVQILDDDALRAITDAFNREAAAPGFAGLLVGHEHFEEDPEKESRAYGWLNKVQPRADGLYGQIRWTATGQAAVDGGDYRFFSTVYGPPDLAVLNKGSARRVRPLKLHGLTLTNKNNNKGQRPITNSNSASLQHSTTPTKRMQQIATKLKLSAEASETAILAEVDQLLNRATAAEAERDTLKARVTGLEESAKTLTTENKELRNRQVDQDLESYADCFKPEDKEKTKTLLITNRAGTIDLFKSFRVLRDEAVKAGPQAIHNRANTGNPGGVGGAPDPIKTFETEFEKELKAGKSKAEAIRILLNRAPDIYRAWLAAGGSKRL